MTYGLLTVKHHYGILPVEHHDNDLQLHERRGPIRVDVVQGRHRNAFRADSLLPGLYYSVFDVQRLGRRQSMVLL